MCTSLMGDTAKENFEKIQQTPPTGVPMFTKFSPTKENELEIR